LKNKRLIVIGFLSLLVIVAVLVVWGQHRRRSAALYYSGTIETIQADVGFQVGGRVRSVHVSEGQAVAADQVLAELDPAEFAARQDQARANLLKAEEGLKQAQTLLAIYEQTLPAEVNRAEAAVEALKAGLAEAQTGFRRQEVQQVYLSLEEAELKLAEALKDKQRYERLFAKGVVSEKEKETADLRHDTALKAVQRARQAYGLSSEGYRAESIAVARARLAEGRAALHQANSNLAKIEAARQDVAAAQAQVEAARAALVLADVQLGQTLLKAPFSATVVSRNVEPGEVVTVAREVMSLSDLSRVDLKVFVDETQIGKVKPGQQAEVRIDTFPDKVYNGTVAYVSPEGEFTPKIIQTRKERVKLVYLVKIAIANPDRELKTGMPADAWFR